VVGLIDTLRREHRDIARLLDALDHQITVFAAAARPDYDIVCGIADYFLDYPDQCHHPKENAVFRALVARSPEVAQRFGDLLREHRTVHDHAVAFRASVAALLNEAEISRSAIVGAAVRFLDGQRHHMRLEEDAFFPVAERTLTPEDWRRIEGDILDARDPLFGDATESRFAALRDRLLAWEREFRSE
jgi:hemerythrin-like domain-containing protein